MNSTKATLNHALVSAFLAVGAIVISAVVSDYSGKIDVSFGSDGIQVQVDGNENHQ
jgi:hypothetical protein